MMMTEDEMTMNVAHQDNPDPQSHQSPHPDIPEAQPEVLRGLETPEILVVMPLTLMTEDQDLPHHVAQNWTMSLMTPCPLQSMQTPVS